MALDWKSFILRPHIRNLTLNEQLRLYNIERSRVYNQRRQQQFLIKEQLANYTQPSVSSGAAGDAETGPVIQDEFIMRVDTTIAGATPSNQFEIKTTGGPYNYDVDWGDGQTDTGVTSATGITHTYATGGEYDIKISGVFSKMHYNNNSEAHKITEIKNWGIIQWTSFSLSFYGAENLDVTATDYPDLSNCTDLSRAFSGCTSLINANGSMGGWDTSTITDMHGTFAGSSFNQNINNWDVSNVTRFGVGFNRGMFASSQFNQPLSNWDVSSCTQFSEMFENNTVFNQDLSNWTFNTSSNVGLGFMFNGATSFNNGGQPGIGNWNTSRVTDMSALFRNADAFNQSIGSWDVSNVTKFRQIFEGANIFNQNLSSWDVSSCTDFYRMFASSPFNNGGDPGIDNWTINTTNPVSMAHMFRYATSFNQPIDNWNISNVYNLTEFMRGVSSFNQTVTTFISNLQGSSNVVAINNIFDGSSAQADWSQFAFQYVNGNAGYAFQSNPNFSGNVSNWQIPSTITSMVRMMRASGISGTDFTDSIVGWAVYIYNNGGVPTGINFTGNAKAFDGTRTSDDASGQTYAVKYGANWTATGWTDAQDAFDYLVTTLSWSI